MNPLTIAACIVAVVAILLVLYCVGVCLLALWWYVRCYKLNRHTPPPYGTHGLHRCRHCSHTVCQTLSTGRWERLRP